MAFLLCIGCQTVTINNDTVSNIESTDVHETNQYSALFALVPFNNDPYNSASHCESTWTQLEVSRGVVDTLRTWGVDTLLFMATTEALGVILLTMAEPFIQGFYGSGIVLDSQRIRVSCKEQIATDGGSHLLLEKTSFSQF